MATTVARLQAVLGADTRDFDRAMGHSESRLKSIAKTGAFAAGAAGIGAIAYTLKTGISEWKQQQEVAAQTQAVLKSTGGAARVTAKHVEELGKSILRKSGYDDEAVKSAENLLLTFTNIRNAAGKTNKIFDQATNITADLARAFHKDLGQSAILVGKALNDPVKGLTALQRVGVQFDEAQKQRIKDLIEGRKAADNIAQVYTGPLSASQVDQIKKLEKLGLGWRDISDQVGIKFTEAQQKALDYWERGGHTMEAQKLILRELNKEVGGSAEAYGKTLGGQISIVREMFNNWAGDMVDKMIPALTRFGNWVRQHWPEIKQHILDAWAAIKPTLEAFKDLVVSVVQTIRRHWGTIGPIVERAVSIVRAQLQIITGIIQFFAAVLRGDWSEAWDALKGIARNALIEVKNVILFWKDILVATIKGVGSALWNGFKAALDAGWQAVKNKISDLFGKVIGWVKDVLGISSPSTVFHGIGQNLVRGFINGVGSMGGVLKNAVYGMAKDALHKLGGVFTGHGSGRSAGDIGGLTKRVRDALVYAYQHGWKGSVTSGFRTYQEQAALYQRYLRGGPLAAPPGTSSHERGEAVDVTDYGTFARIMQGAPAAIRLFNRLGARDPVHFSVSGYDNGGWLPTGLSLAYNNTGRPERVIGPQETLGPIHLSIDGHRLFTWFLNEKQKRDRRGDRF